MDNVSWRENAQLGQKLNMINGLSSAFKDNDNPLIRRILLQVQIKYSK